ncbi:TonB-dependent receptor [uncultured Flavobacterium sp.]|uniref:TonB-dependent receptor domain-containing protein n=1 Tax=uncultured Flavobacterium sp. TaxID=165435 RepID=UPI0030EC0A74|tara:strand:+ start:21513 stop:23618 length:2106 start_codon:yes stop_codon:yes gene_type:complete
MKSLKIYLLLFLLSFISLNAQNTTSKDSLKTTELKEVVLVAKKKAIEQKADRTIFDFSEQAHLNSGSLLEGLKKLPGLIVSDVAGMLYQGKQLEVYMDGRPLNIYSNELNSYLESLPANSVEKIEIITQPGAEFPATSGGAIINIISSRNIKRYLSATYSNGYSYTKYDDSRHRFNNSLLVSARNDFFGWQIQAGQNYNEAYQRTNFYNPSVVLSQNSIDKKNRFYFIKSGLKFDFNRDRLLVNYDFSTSNNNASNNANGFGFVSSDESKTKQNRNDIMLTYQKRFKDITKKIDFRANYNNNKNDFDLRSIPSGIIGLLNNYNQSYYQFKTDYSQEIKLLDDAKWSAGFLADKLDFETYSFDVKNLDYWRTTFSVYTEINTSYKKFDFIAGARLESYKIEGNTNTNKLTPFDLTRFFPNASVQYNIMDQVFFNANYNKKIGLPTTSALNPNNTNYQNPNVSFFGNPNLDPTIYDNYEVKISAFDYIFIGYSVSDASNKVINRIVSTPNGTASVSQNIPQLKVENFNFGLPLPYMLFTKGLQETLKFDFNPDEINFLYIYVGHQKHILDNVDYKGFWNLNLMSQVQLPSKIKFTATYNTSTTGGNYQYYSIRDPFSQQFDLTFSRKFLSDNLSISLYANDILNTNKQGLGAIGTNLIYDSKNDSRRIGFSLNYKIPTKNKVPKEEENILNKEKNEDDTILKK